MLANSQINPLGSAPASSPGGSVAVGDITGLGTNWAGALAANTCKRYVALLTQSGTSAPVATVLENTLGGTVVWGYTSPGVYTATLAGAFAASKTAFFFHSLSSDGFPFLSRTSDNVCTMEVRDPAGDALELSDASSLLPITIEIRVYP